MGQITTATPDIPADGYTEVCAADTACPHTVFTTDPDLTWSMMTDHLLTAHRVLRQPDGRLTPLGGRR